MLESVIRDLIFFRISIPGVMGDWAWRTGEVLAADLLNARRAAGFPESLLMDLARLRWLRAAGAALGLPFDRTVAGLDTDELRALLGRRVSPGPDDDPIRLSAELNRDLDAGRTRFDSVTGFLDDRALAPWLGALEANEAVLDFEVSGPRALALLGTRSGVSRIDLGPASTLRNWTEFPGQFGDAADSRDLLDSGRRVLGPLAERLPDRVYLASADRFALLPLEAMRVGAGVLGERHRFIRLASFPARVRPAERLRGFAVERVFIAGAPSDYSVGFLARLEADPALGMVMDRFRGPGLEVVQGSALAPDEFSTRAFREADLVHLAMPGRLNLSNPLDSWLELSEQRGGAGRERLSARALNFRALGAELVTFSRSRGTVSWGKGAGRPPLVS